MRHFLFSFVAVAACALVYSKIVFEKFETNSNPEFAKIVHTLYEKDGEQYVDIDLNIYRDAPGSLMRTVILSKLTDGEYKEIKRMGPFDPCSDEMSHYKEHRRKHEERFAKHGNMSMGSACPFKKGYYYIRDMKADFGSKLFFNMTPGQYRFNMQAATQENGQDVLLMNEMTYMRIE